jgi:hypothetical protein
MWRSREEREKQERKRKDIRAGATSAKCCSLSLSSFSLGFSVDGWLKKNCFRWARGVSAKGRGRELDFSYRAEAFLLL